MRRALKVTSLSLALIACGCGKDESSENKTPAGTGVIETDNGWVFRTGDFTLAPGEEKFICWAADTPVDLSVQRFSVVGKPVVHHFLMSTVDGTKEPYGASECDVLFKFTWRPMFVAGAGDAHIDIPEGAARSVKAESQVVLQLHLLNSSAKTVTDFAEVKMEKSLHQNPNPVGLYVFGTMNLALPPMQPSSVESKCLIDEDEDVRLFAMMPHMHYMGRKLTLELGPDEANMQTIYSRDPYDFDQQTIEPFDRTISPGTMSRVTCSYDNDRNETVTFGESTTSEMCFAIGFAVGSHPGASVLNGCFSGDRRPDGGGVPKDPGAGQCGQHPISADGVGKPCTLDGGECGDSLFCTAGQPGAQGNSGICIKIGCESTSECGQGATCCEAQGSTNLCIPEACRPEYCIPK
jgi:hypothetical protein